jgi:phosphoribosylformylglycinamidine synthase
MGIVGTLPTAPPIGIPFQNAGRAVILLGGYGHPDAQQFGSSQYAKVITDALWGVPPKIDLEYEKRVHETIRELARSRAVESAHDLSDGGLAVALAESSFGAAGIGAEIRMDSDLSPTMLLFHEGPSRVLVSTADAGAVLELARKNSIEAVEIGVTLKSRVTVRNRTETYFDLRIEDLKQVWENSLTHLLHSSAAVA